jgi:putative transposase
MRRYWRSRIPGGTWFFTVIPACRDMHLLADHATLLGQAFRAVKAVHPFHVDVVVVLAHHLHAAWTLPEGDADYSMRWSLIKAPSSRAIERGESVSGSRQRQRERGIRQRQFHEREIRDCAGRSSGHLHLAPSNEAKAYREAGHGSANAASGSDDSTSTRFAMTRTSGDMSTTST